MGRVTLFSYKSLKEKSENSRNCNCDSKTNFGLETLPASEAKKKVNSNGIENVDIDHELQFNKDLLVIEYCNNTFNNDD